MGPVRFLGKEVQGICWMGNRRPRAVKRYLKVARRDAEGTLLWPPAKGGGVVCRGGVGGNAQLYSQALSGKKESFKGLAGSVQAQPRAEDGCRPDVGWNHKRNHPVKVAAGLF